MRILGSPKHVRERLVSMLIALSVYTGTLPSAKGQPRLVSPEVQSDQRVVFRLRAPNAKLVSIRGSWTALSAMQDSILKDARGDWTITVGPLSPDRYVYHFVVDGLAVADPENPSVKLGIRGPGSILDVPGPEAKFHGLRNVPHGTIHQHRYWSEAAGVTRRMHVYTPPGYESGKERYPVLYLLHGSGDNDSSWFEPGRAAEILDNLLDEKRSRRMLIVAPDGFVTTAAGPESRRRNTEMFGDDLFRNIIPLIETTYRVDARREMRALAGLSMGGGQALNIGLPRLNAFSYLGVFSSGPLSQGATVPQFLDRHAATLRNPAEVNRKLRVFWVGCGTDDTAGVANTQALIDLLKERNIRHDLVWTRGGHNWTVWRDNLHSFLPLLFR